jgi:hypothetical protein
MSVKPPITHLEVIVAKEGSMYGIEDGNLLRVEKETPCFFFVCTHNGKVFKVSKKTKRIANWKRISTSPIFNI